MVHDAAAQRRSEPYGFISYSHHDREYVQRLCRHLLPAARAELGTEFWMDDSINAGNRWDKTMSDVLAQANIFVLCMSADYFAADFIYNSELPTIEKQSRLSQGLVIPVILKPCSWWGFVGDLQVIPTKNGRVLPISNWRPQEGGYHEATKQVIQAIRWRFVLGMTDLEPSGSKIRSKVPRRIQSAPRGPHTIPPRDIDRAVKTVIARRASKSEV